MKVKICGMRDPDNIAAIAAEGIDMLGFIFYPPSPRFVYKDGTDPLPLGPGAPSRVGVFVDADIEEVQREVERWQLTYVQLHGDESPEYCRELKGMVSAEVIKAFRVGPTFSETEVEIYADAVDLFLFDTYGESYGGTGKVFSWEVLTGLGTEVPYLISGGLGPDNIQSLVEFVSAHPGVAGLCCGIDLNSGVEDAPALKNPLKVREVVEILNTEKEGGRVQG